MRFPPLTLYFNTKLMSSIYICIYKALCLSLCLSRFVCPPTHVMFVPPQYVCTPSICLYPLNRFVPPQYVCPPSICFFPLKMFVPPLQYFWHHIGSEQSEPLHTGGIPRTFLWNPQTKNSSLMIHHPHTPSFVLCFSSFLFFDDSSCPII